MAAHHNVVAEVLNERIRQIHVEGYSPDHDDQLRDEGDLPHAAACYALFYALFAADPDHVRQHGMTHDIECNWPWPDEEWKPKDPRRDLIRAAALIVAEIERLDRKAAR